MASEAGPLLERVRQSDYTGENRCLPCTVVNLVIAAILTGLAAFVALELAAAVLAVSLVAIYLRGYLVPGTPALTRRYLPDGVLRAFGKDPTEEVAWDPEELDVLAKVEDERANEVVPAEFLLEVGVVADGDDGRRLADGFADRIEARFDARRGAPAEADALAALFDADPQEVAELGREYPAYEVGIRVRKWPSETALRTDLATHEAFETWTDRWATVPMEQRVEILRSLRTLREDCPACGGELRQSDEALESCCYSAELVMLTCTDCGDRLLEADPSTADLPHPSGI